MLALNLVASTIYIPVPDRLPLFGIIALKAAIRPPPLSALPLLSLPQVLPKILLKVLFRPAGTPLGVLGAASPWWLFAASICAMVVQQQQILQGRCHLLLMQL
jgi:hypothetical protein